MVDVQDTSLIRLFYLGVKTAYAQGLLPASSLIDHSWLGYGTIWSAED